MKERKRAPARPSDSEWAIMKVMWKHGPMAAGEIYDHLAAEQDWAYSTVKTLVRRLTEKGWLSYQRVGNSFLYRAAVPQKKAVRSAIREFSDRVLNGVLSPFVAYYAEQENLSEDDLEQLEEILRRHRKKEK